MTTPLLVVGDAPNLPTGLGRIARDVAARIKRHIPEVRVAQLGLYYSGGKFPWHVYPMRDEENWGQRDIAGCWEEHAGEDRKGAVLSFWDPGRCPALPWGLEAAAKTRWRRQAGAGREKPKLWGYFAVDAEDSKGGLGGPVRDLLRYGYQRKLAYTPYGAEVLEKAAADGQKIPWLPHGLDLEVFQPQAELPDQFQESWRGSSLPIVGCVATNTPRKDLGAVFAALEGVDCHLWLHTDRMTTSAWSITELAQQFGRNNPDRLQVSGVEGPLEDTELARWYSVCAATLAPGAGEGFCYPGVESLACGTPVICTDYAGLPEFVPEPRWKIRPTAYRLEGAYAIKRPVVDPGKIRAAVVAAADWKQREPAVVREYCRLAVAHLGWDDLWPWWEKWVREGLAEL